MADHGHVPAGSAAFLRPYVEFVTEQVRDAQGRAYIDVGDLGPTKERRFAVGQFIELFIKMAESVRAALAVLTPGNVCRARSAAVQHAGSR